MNNYLKTDCGHIHLDYETIDAVEAVVKLIEVDPKTLTELQRGNAFRRPMSKKYYHLEILSLSGDLIATGRNTSHKIWNAIRCGEIGNNDHVAVELETVAFVLPDKPIGDNWTSIFAEAMCVMYVRIRLDNQKYIFIHKAENLKKIGDKEYSRSFEPIRCAPMSESTLNRFFKMFKNKKK